MIVTSYKTPKVVVGTELYPILDKYLPKLKERDIVVITSKIIAICQGNVIKNDGKIDKKDLIKKEADMYISVVSDYGTVWPTIKNNILLANSGIDESNGNGYFVLWPKNIDTTTADIWNYLKKKHALRHLGIIVTDSRLTPLSFGLTGMAISWCGFEALQDYRGTKDIFGRKLIMSQKNIPNGIAASAELVMGEGSEQTPLGVVSGVPDFVVFQNRPSTQAEKDALLIELKNDIYAAFLKSAPWKKGGRS